MFDPVTMVFYGTICGVLALASPVVESRWTRFGVGIAVGLVAAFVLPLVRRAAGI
jgi:hypothetical protein